MTPTLSPHRLPPRRLLAVAAAIALFGGQTQAAQSGAKRQPATLNGTEVVCPLGSIHCMPRPDNYGLCRPNAMLSFYEPQLSKDASLRDSSLTHVAAENVNGADQTVYHLSGNVKLTRADQQIQSDAAAYNQDTSDYDAQGYVRYQDYSQLMTADHMRGNQNASSGIATGDVRFQMLDSHGNGTASQGQMFDATHARYSTATYSTCDIGHHVWEIRGKRIDTNKDTEVGLAHSATLRYHNIPLIYLPLFSFPIGHDRKSGFLFPTVGSTGRAGVAVSIPYYFNLAPNYDATLTPMLYVERGPMVQGEFRYLNVARSTGTLDINYLASDQRDDRNEDGDNNAFDSKGRPRYLIKYQDNTQLWAGWSLNINVNHASDSSYLRDFGNGLYDISVGELTSSAYVNNGGLWGKNTFWNASFGVDDYQNVNPELEDSVVQYKRWPRATFNVSSQLNRWLETGINTEAVQFRKDSDGVYTNPTNKTGYYSKSFVEGKRLDLYPYIQADFQGAAWFVRPRVGYRYTAYQLDGSYQDFGYQSRVVGRDLSGFAAGTESPFNKRTPARSLPIISLDSGLVFERDTSIFGNGYTQTLEPRLFYLYVPYRNQNNIPIFDTTLNSFDYWQLFSTNQYAGADRQMNANNLTAALTSRLLDEDGVERVSLSIGQIRYFTSQKVRLPNGQNTVSAVLHYPGSDYVVQLNTQLNDQWRLNSDYQWNPNTHQTDMGALELQHRLGRDGVLNFSYRFRRYPGSVPVAGDPTSNEMLKQYDFSAVYPVSDRWRLIGHWIYSPLSSQTIEATAGVQYESCCMRVSLVGRHYVEGLGSVGFTTAKTRTPTTNAVMFMVEFKGLGAINGQQEDLLRRGILGYQ